MEIIARAFDVQKRIINFAIQMKRIVLRTNIQIAIYIDNLLSIYDKDYSDYILFASVNNIVWK